jgi:hypothetical protein
MAHHDGLAPEDGDMVDQDRSQCPDRPLVDITAGMIWSMPQLLKVHPNGPMVLNSLHSLCANQAAAQGCLPVTGLIEL